MSDTTTTNAIAQATNKDSLVTNLRTALLVGANDAPQVIREVAALDPDLRTQIEGKSAVASKTIWAPIASHIVAWAVGYFGLSWDAQTTEMASLGLSVLLMAAARFVTDSPITSLLPK